MRILVLIVALIALSTERALAEWTVGGNSEGLTYYIDRDSIQREGDSALMWNLTDYEKPQGWQGQAFYSSKAQFEYDCIGRRTRVMEEAGFSEHMGKGAQTYTVHGPRDWATAKPGSVAETRLGIACGRSGQGDGSGSGSGKGVKGLKD